VYVEACECVLGVTESRRWIVVEHDGVDFPSAVAWNSCTDAEAFFSRLASSVSCVRIAVIESALVVADICAVSGVCLCVYVICIVVRYFDKYVTSVR
jgi:hypothetical protein